MDQYGTPSEKISLVLAGTQVAKQGMVADEGIGEDLPFTLMVWCENTLSAVCQLDTSLADEQPGERLVRTVEAAAACRRGFNATSFTFVTEGFCATDPQAVDPDTPLAVQFITNPDVRECLTVTHIEAGNIYLAALPYRYALGRRMEWEPALRYEPTFPSTNQFLTSMSEILLKDPFGFTPDDSDWRDAVADEVARWGFHIQYDLDITP